MPTPSAEFYPDGLVPLLAAEDGAAGQLAYRRRPLTPDALRVLTTGLAGRTSALRAVPIREVIDGLAAVHARWAESGSPLRQEAVPLVQTATGYATTAIDEALQRLFSQMDAHCLETWLTETGIPQEALDAEAGPDSRLIAFGPRLTAVVASGNVPGAAVPSVVQALLLKSPCVVKTASGEPILLPLYARSLAERAPHLAQALAVTGWRGGDADLETALLSEVEALIAYGSDEAMLALRRQLPVRARWIAYGHRLSFSAIGRELLAAEDAARLAAQQAALDLSVFDQQGCYSPQTVFVERGGAVPAARFGELLAEALETLSGRLPRHPLSAAESAAIHQFRTAAEMRMLGGEGRLWASAGSTQWTVVLEISAALLPCVLNRTAVLRPINDLDELPEVIRAQRGHLMSAALGVAEARYFPLAARLGEVGLVRVTQLGRAQMPQDALRHDGINAISALARMVVVE